MILWSPFEFLLISVVSLLNVIDCKLILYHFNFVVVLSHASTYVLFLFLNILEVYIFIVYCVFFNSKNYSIRSSSKLSNEMNTLFQHSCFLYKEIEFTCNHYFKRGFKLLRFYSWLVPDDVTGSQPLHMYDVKFYLNFLWPWSALANF